MWMINLDINILNIFSLSLCAIQVPSVVKAHGDYLQVYTTHLQDSLASYPDQALRNSIEDLVVDGYNVMLGEYPPEERLLNSGKGSSNDSSGDGWVYDCVMMTGSGKFFPQGATFCAVLY